MWELRGLFFYYVTKPSKNTIIFQKVQRLFEKSLAVVEQTVCSGYTKNRFKLQRRLPKFRRNLERTVPREVNQTKLVCSSDARLSSPNYCISPIITFRVLLPPLPKNR
jgi:hypothetical protein